MDRFLLTHSFDFTLVSYMMTCESQENEAFLGLVIRHYAFCGSVGGLRVKGERE